MGCLQGQGLNEEKGVPSEQIHPWERDFYDPDFFDAAAGDAPIDTNLDWYSDKIGVASTSVLDLGCGTGRFTLSLLGKGHRVIAVDRSEKMLARLKQKCAGLTAEARRRLSIVHADLATSGPTGRASFAIAPDDFLTHFLSITSLSAALESIRESLETGGKFLTDFRPRSERYLERAARGFPKPMKSFGTVPNALIDGKPRAIGTRAGKISTSRRESSQHHKLSRSSSRTAYSRPRYSKRYANDSIRMTSLFLEERVPGSIQ